METHTTGITGDPLTVVQALELVSQFFTKEWLETSPSTVKIRQITSGFVNRIYVLSRSSVSRYEPSSILIRLFGTKGSFQDPSDTAGSLTATEQALVSFEMGRRGWGPQVYGVFKGGRLEEWIDSHTLTAAEAMNPVIRRDIARSYARLHSLDLPLRKNGFDSTVQQLKSLLGRIPDACRALSTSLNPEATTFVDVLRTTAWNQELDWVYETFQRLHCKPAYAIGDTNFLNVLVKNYDSDCKVMLIDYETLTYSFRGIDVGGHFNERMYDWSHPSNCLTGFDPPDIDEQRSFCEAYHQEMLRLGSQVDEYDSVDYLLEESRIGGLYQLLFSVLMCLGDVNGLDIPHVLSGLCHMMEQYQQSKSEFD